MRSRGSSAPTDTNPSTASARYLRKSILPDMTSTAISSRSRPSSRARSFMRSSASYNGQPACSETIPWACHTRALGNLDALSSMPGEHTQLRRARRAPDRGSDAHARVPRTSMLAAAAFRVPPDVGRSGVAASPSRAAAARASRRCAQSYAFEREDLARVVADRDRLPDALHALRRRAVDHVDPGVQVERETNRHGSARSRPCVRLPTRRSCPPPGAASRPRTTRVKHRRPSDRSRSTTPERRPRRRTRRALEGSCRGRVLQPERPQRGPDLWEACEDM